MNGSKRSAGVCHNLNEEMAEDLTDYFKELGLKVKYLHSDIKHWKERRLFAIYD